MCGNNTNCTNVDGSYTCRCLSGFSGDPMVECKNIEECIEQPNICQHGAECTDTDGGYYCTCIDPGYEGNDTYCRGESDRFYLPFSDCIQDMNCSDQEFLRVSFGWHSEDKIIKVINSRTSNPFPDNTTNNWRLYPDNQINDWWPLVSSLPFHLTEPAFHKSSPFLSGQSCRASTLYPNGILGCLLLR